MSPRRASAPCQREVSLDRLLEVAQTEVVARMLLDRIQELVIQEDEKMFYRPHYWKNPALRRSQDLAPPSKWNSSDAVKNRREMKTNEVIVW